METQSQQGKATKPHKWFKQAEEQRPINPWQARRAAPRCRKTLAQAFAELVELFDD
jgi:hypothetical protein